MAFAHLLHDAPAHRYGIEIDAYRAEQARALGIETLQANAMDVRCPAESLSLLYLNPPYDWEAGETNNQRLEVRVSGAHLSMAEAGWCAGLCDPPASAGEMRETAERAIHGLPVFRLTEPASVQYKQVAVLAVPPQTTCPPLRYGAARWVRDTSRIWRHGPDLDPLGDTPDAKYEVPSSGPIVLTNAGIPLDEVEDLLLDSAAYRQASRLLLPKQRDVRGRPLTPLHGGHVGLLCTAGMLNGVFGEGEDRHIAHWRSVKFTDHWEEEEEDGTKILHDRERFSHELTLVFADGKDPDSHP